MRDRTAEIRRLEEAYTRVDEVAAKKKEKLAKKISSLKAQQGMA